MGGDSELQTTGSRCSGRGIYRRVIGKLMKSQPAFTVGDTVVYKSGKRGYHYGWDNGMTALVEKLELGSGKGEWGGWTVLTSLSNLAFPAGWFRKA
jgi:hypothetical protein